MNKIFIWLIILLLSFETAFAAADEDVQVTVRRTSLNNAETEEFIDRCLENPEYYQFTSLGQIREALQSTSPKSQKLIATLTAEDGQVFLGWYKITETKRETGSKQISGLLILEGDKTTGYIEAHLVYLPRELLLSRESLSPKVLEWAKNLIEPLIGTELPFFDELDETLTPRFQDTQVRGTCATISCWNYPSLITATRSEFKVATLVSRTFWGHGYLLVYPPYVPGSNTALDEYLADNPGMPALVERAQEGLNLLENRGTRDEGKHVLKGVYRQYSGIYRLAGWTAAGVATTAAALAAWWYFKR